MLPSNIHSHKAWLESLIFGHRRWVCGLFGVITLLLLWQLMTGLKVDARFEKMVPQNHPFIQNMMRHLDHDDPPANVIRIAVVNPEGTIFSERYMRLLNRVSDEVFYLPGVDRTHLKSLWAPSVRWIQVTEEGFTGGPVVPDNYDGSAQSLEKLRENILRSGEVGRLVANDFSSSLISAPLFEVNPETGEALDYKQLSEQLEDIRRHYSEQGVDIRIVGLAKIFGDLFAAVDDIILFFIFAIIITILLLLFYTRCWRSSLLTVAVSLVAVIWQMGLLAWIGISLDLYSVLVPFLVFAIAVSHGVQVLNHLRIEVRNGSGYTEAARMSFRVLYRPGMLALLSDAIGFGTLLVIDIQVIQDLAITAGLGVVIIILTNLILLPVLLSQAKVLRVKKSRSEWLWRWLSLFARRDIALVSVIVAIVALVLGIWLSRGLAIGNLEPGAPEFHSDSRYNLDNQYIIRHYGTSADLFVVFAETEEESCSGYPFMEAIDRYMWQMENTEGVQGTLSLVTASKRVIRGLNEGNLKWQTLSRDPYILNNSIANVAALHNSDCSSAPVIVYLNDHKAETLARVSAKTRAFARENNNDQVRFVMAGGNAGVEAATNEVIATAQYEMLLWVYGVVSLLCLMAFRSIRAVLCIVIPLVLTSVLCQALMAVLGIGVKVATLPVIALGVGIGVDYGIYIFSHLESFLRRGMPLQQAYYNSLKMAGRAVILTALSLAISVGIWIFSPLKFQADMGLLLVFMFLWNMVGAIWLLPALARFLLVSRKN